MFYIGLITFVFFSPVIIFGVAAFWIYVLSVLEERGRRKWQEENPPFCDIDPRCHSAFAWDKDGGGWIGDVCVFPAEGQAA